MTLEDKKSRGLWCLKIDLGISSKKIKLNFIISWNCIGERYSASLPFSFVHPKKRKLCFGGSCLRALLLATVWVRVHCHGFTVMVHHNGLKKSIRSMLGPQSLPWSHFNSLGTTIMKEKVPIMSLSFPFSFFLSQPIKDSPTSHWRNNFWLPQFTWFLKFLFYFPVLLLFFFSILSSNNWFPSLLPLSKVTIESSLLWSIVFFLSLFVSFSLSHCLSSSHSYLHSYSSVAGMRISSKWTWILAAG